MPTDLPKASRSDRRAPLSHAIHWAAPAIAVVFVFGAFALLTTLQKDTAPPSRAVMVDNAIEAIR
jgi:hypothetical protein